MTYPIEVAGLKRELPICKVTDDLYIGAFICFGDAELTVACARELLKLVPADSYDYIFTAEAKSIPLIHEMARQSGAAKYFMMDCGIDVGAVNKALFRTKSAVRLAMEARMVADMERYDNGRVVVMSIPLSLCRELHATEADIEELSSLAALVQGTDCSITLRELKPGRVKISLRTGSRVDACAVCRVLGGGGHKAAAGATVEGTMDEVKAGILAAYREVVG